MTERTSATDDMALKAAFKISCEQPGFTMLRTCIKNTINFFHFICLTRHRKSSTKLTRWVIINLPCQDMYLVLEYGPYNPSPEYAS